MSVTPFSNGAQFGDWCARNCNRCEKYNSETFDGTCDIDGALGMAYIDSGEVEDSIAERMGYTANREAYTWDCPERVLR